MRFSVRVRRLALATFAGACVAAPGAASRAEEAAGPSATAGGDACAEGQLREGKNCMHHIAPPGACASARGRGEDGGTTGASACGDGAIGAASNRFSPVDVAAGGSAPGGGFTPPAPGPGPGPQPQPCDVGCGPPGGGPPGGGPPPPPPAPGITVIESPAVPDPLPGLK